MKKLMVLFLVCILSTLTQAAIVGPYAVDGNTLHLWHMDGDGVPVNDEVAGGVNMGYPGNGATLGSASFAGYGKALNTYLSPRTAQANPYLSPVALVSGAGDNITTAYAGADGAFTMEAIVRLDLNPSVVETAVPGNAPMQIISAEGDTNPERIFQWRLVPRNASLPLRMEFINLRQAASGQVQTLTVNLPESTSDAPAQGGWYHTAVVYSGQENTDNNFKCYWTLMDESRVAAAEIFSGKLVNDMSTAAGDLVIGNEGRAFTNNGQSDNFMGLIDEVRISSIARAADEMAFVPEPMTLSLLGLGGLALIKRRN